MHAESEWHTRKRRIAHVAGGRILTVENSVADVVGAWLGDVGKTASPPEVTHR